MTHQEIIQRFENDAIAEDSFHHVDHVRLAFAYLCEYPVLPALERFVTALKRFAAAREKAQLYHETITHAYFFLIRERMAGSRGADWDECHLKQNLALKKTIKLHPRSAKSFQLQGACRRRQPLFEP
jgi:hypothetical protein